MVTSAGREQGLTRRRLFGVVGATAVGVGVLFAYPTSTGHGTARTSAVSAAGGASGGTAGTAGTAATAGTGGATTYTGDTVQTQWGPVQVAITVSSGKITAATTVQVPNGNPRDDEINSYAVPVLNSEVVATQNANIDMVSGATVTSDGYIQSLQSALDQAGL